MCGWWKPLLGLQLRISLSLTVSDEMMYFVVKVVCYIAMHFNVVMNNFFRFVLLPRFLMLWSGRRVGSFWLQEQLAETC